MFCMACGTSLTDDAAFCARCGRPIGSNPPVPSTGEIIEAVQANSAPTTQYYTRPAASPQQAAHAPIYVTQQVQVAPTIMRPLKSVGLAIFLGLFFGPFGLFYASVAGGLIMLVGGLLITAATAGVAAPFVWITCAIWAGIAANSYNSQAQATYGAPTQINRH